MADLKKADEEFLLLKFTDAFDLLYEAQYYGAWTVDDIQKWTKRAGEFCNRYEYIARAGQKRRAKLHAMSPADRSETDVEAE